MVGTRNSRGVRIRCAEWRRRDARRGVGGYRDAWGMCVPAGVICGAHTARLRSLSELCHSAESVYVDVGWFVNRQVMAPMCTGLFFAYKCVRTSHLATDLRFQIRLVTGSPNPDLTCRWLCRFDTGICRQAQRT